jgi:hypothetical protein
MQKQFLKYFSLSFSTLVLTGQALAQNENSKYMGQQYGYQSKPLHYVDPEVAEQAHRSRERRERNREAKVDYAHKKYTVSPDSALQVTAPYEAHQSEVLKHAVQEALAKQIALTRDPHLLPGEIQHQHTVLLMLQAKLRLINQNQIILKTFYNAYLKLLEIVNSAWKLKVLNDKEPLWIKSAAQFKELISHLNHNIEINAKNQKALIDFWDSIQDSSLMKANFLKPQRFNDILIDLLNIARTTYTFEQKAHALWSHLYALEVEAFDIPYPKDIKASLTNVSTRLTTLKTDMAFIDEGQANFKKSLKVVRDKFEALENPPKPQPDTLKLQTKAVQ